MSRRRTAAPGLDRARELAPALALDRVYARGLACQLALDPDLVLTLDRTRELALTLDLADTPALVCHDRACLFSRALLETLKAINAVGAAEGERATVAGRRPSRCAGRLAGFAVWMVPPAQRPRYREEFRAELYDLAGRRWWRQLAYGARLLCRACELRRVVSGAARFPARER